MSEMSRHRLFGCLVVLLCCLAACAKQTELVATPDAGKRFLKLRGYEFDQKGFFAAVTAQDLTAINAFILAGIDINTRDPRDGRTALSSASARGDKSVVKALLDAGADVNVKDSSGYTALFHSIDARYDDVTD